MEDQIERWESAAERNYDEMSVGDGKLKCFCGKIFDPSEEGGTLNPNPHSMPGCGDCFEEAIKAMEAQKC